MICRNLKKLLLIFLICSVAAVSSASSKPRSFVKLVNNEIIFSTETGPVPVQVTPESISGRVARNITPETEFSQTALPEISIKLSPNEKALAKRVNISIAFRLKSQSGKTLAITLDNIKLRKNPVSQELKIVVPFDSKDTFNDDLIAFEYKTTTGFSLKGDIGNDKETGPVLTNGTDTISFNILVFKNKIIEKFKNWGISDISLTGTPAYSFILKGTSLAIDIGDGKYKAINSINGKITVQ